LDKVLGTQEDYLKIINVISSLNTIREISRLLDEILNAAVILIDAEAGSIILKEKETGFFTIKAAIGDKAEQFKGVKIPVNKGIVGWTVMNNASLLISDVATDTRWYNKSDKETGFQTKSIICVPLAMDDNVFGAIEVLNKRNGGLYDVRDEQILNILGALAATTIYNLILFKEVEESKKKIESIINGMADGVMLLDKNYKVTVANPAANQIFNFSQDSGSNTNALNTLISEISSISMPDLLDVVLLKPEGTVLSCKITYLQSSEHEREGIIVALRNITKIKEKERRKSEILMLIAYQLKEPIAKLINVQKEKIVSTADETVKKQEVLMLKRIEFISELITKLIYYAHIDTGPMRLERKPQLVLPVFESIMNDVQEYIHLKQIQMVINIDANLKIKFDQETIAETLRNLLLDAILRSSEGSSISVVLDTAAVGPEVNYVRLIIEDDGKSFSHDEKQRIFSLEKQIDKFMDSEDELKDLNLTHAFASYILSAHGGNITIGSNNQKNVTIITLPKE